MRPQAETERLARVYASYAADPATHTRWDGHNPGNAAIFRERSLAIHSLLAECSLLPLAGRWVLEVGCGSGGVLASLRDLGASPSHLHGIDLLPDRVTRASMSYPGIAFQVSNAEALPFPDGRFDLVVLFTVFSSILDPTMAGNVAGEVLRVLRPGSAVLWYDFRYNNPRNPHVRGMKRAAIQALFPGFEMRLRAITLLPPLARRLGPATALLYPLLASVPLLQTHYLGLFVKR